MSTVTRLAAFAALLGLAFGGAALAGAAIDPTDSEETAPAAHASAEPGDSGHGSASNEEEDGTMDTDEHENHAGGSEPAAGGLEVSSGGYTLRPRRTIFTARGSQRFAFEIVADGRPVRNGYESTHEQELHLIAVRRDTATFAHEHPHRAADGTWSTDLTFPEPGVYRVFADFKHDGEARTLSTDVFVGGQFEPKPLPAPEPRDETDGFEVELRGAESLRAGREQELTFAVSRDGRPVEALQDYLGAKGHLVALREGDLAYLHVHPLEGGTHEHGGEETAAHANEVPFAATFPTAGRYRLFLQFKTDGEVRTVDYTVEVPR